MPNSYNGWPASDDKGAIGVVSSDWFPGGVKSGDVATVLRYVAEQMNARVETIVEGWNWGYTYKANVNNPSQLSCHASGTAIDYNAPNHANGSSGTFTDAQVGTIYSILAEVQGAVDWLEGYDEMHFEIAVDAGTLAGIAAQLPGGGGGPAPIPPLPDNAEDDVMQLIAGNSGNGAIFAYCPGRFIHVIDPDHLDVGNRRGVWDSSNVPLCDLWELDVLRDNCIGNGEGKGDNITGYPLPSQIAGG